MSNTKQQIREILEQHHSIVTLELGEKVIEAIDRLVTEARIEELQGSLVALTSHAKPIRENAIEHMENRIAELQSQLTNKENK